jgi:hypothetical protein
MNNPLELGEAPATLEHHIREFLRNNLKVQMYSDLDDKYIVIDLNLKESDGTLVTISRAETQ